MPRGRAVRVIGFSLAAIAIPGIRPRLAAAQAGVCTKMTCAPDQRCCQKGAEASFKTYCCPSPSWQWQCGAQHNNYRCTNICPSGRKTFPCTAAIAHPESGINGVCCDRRIHSGCVAVGPPREKRPDGTFVPSQEWKPSCCPKGPGFSFCGGVCCEPPNRCRNGICRCPDGTLSLDGRRCCKSGQRAQVCLSGGTREDPGGGIDASVVGRKCCPTGMEGCCGSTCCKKQGCCDTKCCPFETSRCARAWRGDGISVVPSSASSCTKASCAVALAG